MSRPRTFDIDTATEQALQVFWKKGYEGATLGDLTEAMGINRPSLYAAFGSKEGLFERALERYTDGQGAGFRDALEAPTAREVVTAVLRFYADAVGRRSSPRGCLLVQGALTCSDEGESIKRVLGEKRHALEAALTARIERAQQEGELVGHDAADLSRYVWTVCQGMTVQAVDGKSRAEMRRIADMAMRAWPE